MQGVQRSYQVFFQLVVIFQGIFLVSAFEIEVSAGCTVTKFSDVASTLQKCDTTIISNLTVPAGKTLNLDLRDDTSVYFRGVLKFGHAEWEGPLIAINGTGVTIAGETGSVLDGQGQLYWDGQGEWGSLKPKFFIIQLHNSTIRDIYVKNCPVHCVLLADSSDVEFLDWTIDNQAGDPDVAGPGKYGHNTDGFDVWNSNNIVLKNGIIYNQDDCVALRCGANILVDNFYCHGGHGLSISVGFSNDSIPLNTLRNVTISNSMLYGGENGIHIKTHVDGWIGSIENITYENILIRGPASYGINIQENYRNLPANSSFPSDPKNNIPIRTLRLRDISGNVTSSAVPIYILCADEGCFDWYFSNIGVLGVKSNNCNYVPNGFNC